MSLSVKCYDSNTESGLQAAILLYGTGNRMNFASIHDVDHSASQPRIKAGVPASKIAIAKLMESLVPDQAMPKVILPWNVLACGPDYLMWYTKPSQRNLWFQCSDVGGNVNGVVPLPGLVFLVTAHGGWYVFAYKGKDRPDLETEMFNSPFMNVWNGGHICEGNVVRPESLTVDSIGAWEDVFFQSRFTHLNVPGEKAVKYKAGAHQFWRDMLAGKWKSFPNPHLVSTGRKLQYYFDQIVVKGQKA